MTWAMSANVIYARVRPRGEAAFGSLSTQIHVVNGDHNARMPLELDKLDRRILAIIQRDVGQRSEQIGASVGLSASAVQRRIARLREAGVITAEVAIIDPASVGRSLTVIVDVEVERERSDLLAEFNRWIAHEPAVQEAWYVTGDGDYVLIMTARDVAEYEQLTQKMMADNGNVKRFRTRVALGTLKRGTSVPIDDSTVE